MKICSCQTAKFLISTLTLLRAKKKKKKEKGIYAIHVCFIMY